MSELGDLVAWIKANLELIAEARAAATTAAESLNTGRTHLRWVMEGAENDYPEQAVGSLNTAEEDSTASLPSWMKSLAPSRTTWPELLPA